MFVLPDHAFKEQNLQTDPFLVPPYYGTEQITQGYHDGHQAYDYKLRFKTILAAEEGIIKKIRWYSNRLDCHQSGSDLACGYGLHVMVEHPNGYWTIYGHMSATAVFEVGETISQGQILGTSGHNGYSTGPHLHFEVRSAGEYSPNVDPYASGLWLDGDAAGRPFPRPNDGGEYINDDVNTNNVLFSKGSEGPFNNPCNGNCGGWTRNTSTGHDYDMFYTLADGNTVSNQWAMWTNTGARRGLYEVKIHVPTYTDKTWRAPYSLQDPEGLAGKAIVDQASLPNSQFTEESEWVSIGTFSSLNYSVNPNLTVYTTDATQEPYEQHCGAGKWCNLIADAVKFIRSGSVFLPDVKTFGGWNSTLYVRNDGAGKAYLHLEFLDASGNALCINDNLVIEAHSREDYSAASECMNDNVRSAIIDSTQPISVVVIQSRLQDSEIWSAYTGVTSPANYIYIPIAHRNNYRWYSHFFIQNTSWSTSSVNIEFYDSNGQLVCNRGPYNILPQGHYLLATSDVPYDCLNPAGYVGSAKITASHPVAVSTTQMYFDTSNKAKSLIESEVPTDNLVSTYAPIFHNYNFGWISGISIQNLTDIYNGVNTKLYRRTGSICYTMISSLYPYQSQFIISPGYPTPCSDTILSAKSYLPSVTINGHVNQTLIDSLPAGGYPTISMVKSSVYFPIWKSTWQSGVLVLNPNMSINSITLRCYTKAGNKLTDQIFTLGPSETKNINFPYYLDGSCLILSELDKPIAAASNHHTSANGDYLVSYIGVPR